MHEDAIRHLHEALKHLLAARVGLGFGDSPDVPHEALDLALGADARARDVRRQVRLVLDLLLVSDGAEIHQAAFDLEAAFNTLVSIGLDVGFKVGVMTRK